MAQRYAVTALQTPVSSSDKTIVELTGGTAVQMHIYDIMWGASGTPADNALVYGVRRQTASGTGTGVTPEPLDAQNALAAEVAAEEDNTIEPTYAGIHLIELPVNQRASYRWVAAPGGEFKSAIAAGDGFGSTVRSAAYTGQAEATIHFIE